MEKLISYQEYKNIIGIKPSVVEDEFNQMQLLALSYIKNSMAQIQIFPESANIFKYLKDYYKEQFIQALCYEIDYLGINKAVILDNPISLMQSLSTGSYSSGPVGAGEIEQMQKKLCPIANSILLSMGWLYSSLDTKLEPSIYYNSVYLEFMGQEKIEIPKDTLSYITFQVKLSSMDEPLFSDDVRVEVESSKFSLVQNPLDPTLIQLSGTVPAGNYLIKLVIREKHCPQVVLRKNIYVEAI